VADSVAAGAVEWNTSLGGTLMAAVDDLRHLVTRPFTDEDSEHLAHRASELRPFVKSVIPSNARDLHVSTPTTTADSSPSARNDSVPNMPTPPPLAAPQNETKIVPISDLFYADAGPHIVSGGMPKEASARSDLLGKGIDALDNLVMKPIAKPVTFGAMEIVPVETLIYRGRAALERAAALREQIKGAGGAASQATLEEMYDLIGLALKD
jgi:hypothetical protein